MIGSGATSAEEHIRALAGAAWLFRWQVEVEAEERFTRLSAALERLGAAPDLVAMARRSAEDERRHAAHCARLAAAHGRPVPATPPPPAPPVAPSGLPEREAVTYELAAACCVTESVSVAVLTALLPEARDPGLRAVLRELAEDEVVHARLGWAHLASEQRRGGTSFLGPWLPAMLAGSQDGDLFGPAPPGRDEAALLQAGVLPHARQRDLFVQSLREVVFPGLEQVGVDAGAGRQWLEEQLARG